MSVLGDSATAPKGDFSKIALIGNPNAGKTTLFNCLTGLRQRVGNYPGVTVQRKSGVTFLGKRQVEITDLPGTYSLAADSPDERVVVDALRGEVTGVDKPDLILCIVDSTNLQRHLFLAHQLGQLGLPMVLALNYWDSAKKRNIEVNVDRLAGELGIPVVPISASRAEGVDVLRKTLESALDSGSQLKMPEWPEAVVEALNSVKEELPAECTQKLDDASILRSVFDEDKENLLRAGVSSDVASSVLAGAKKKLFKGGLNPTNAEAVLLYRHIKGLVEKCINTDGAVKGSGSESIDALLTHRWWGLVAFLGLMYVVFQSVYSWAGPFMDLIDGAKAFVQSTVSGWLASWPMIQSLVTDGMIEGVGAVVIFLPQILILFFFITLLEDTGYMARAAFLMDKLFSWCGLSGKSFVPLLSSYACAIPGVMATRTIQDPKARLVTVLVAPFMSCSARLPVYVLMIGAFIEPRYGAGIAGVALFGMHFVGGLVAMPFAFVMNKYVLKTPSQPFLLELPEYQVPKFKDVLIRMYSQGREFVINAGTVIFAITVVIWALLYFPRSAELEESLMSDAIARVAVEENVTVDSLALALENDEEMQAILESNVASALIEQSYMGRIGKTVQPVFDASGFDWKVTVGVLASFPAREVIISTLGIIYSLGGDVDEESGDLREAMASQKWQSGEKAGQPVFTIPVVISIMVFFALCQQCGATLAIIAQETSWKWATVSFFLMTGLAWICSVLVNQIGSIL